MEPLKIKEAADSLYKHLTKTPEDEGVFCVYPVGDRIRIDVNFIYRMPEAEAITSWEGYHVFIGRRSCW